MKILNKLIRKVAEEVHKSKIDELEKRIVEMEKDHKVNLKVISDNETRINKLESKLWETSLEAAKIESTVKTILYLREHVPSTQNKK